MHILSDANGLPLVVGVSAANVHDSEGLKPTVAGHQTRHAPHNGRYFKPQRLHADKAYMTDPEVMWGPSFPGCIRRTVCSRVTVRPVVLAE